MLVDAFAGLVLTTILRHFYHAIWEKPVYVRVVGILVASYIAAAIWQPIKNFSQFFYYDDFRAGSGVQPSRLLQWDYRLLLLPHSWMEWIVLWSEVLSATSGGTATQYKGRVTGHEAQLRMLRYQLNPHFLFNTLNAISTLILEQKTRTANEMVSKLSNFLRYSSIKIRCKK